MMFFGVCDEFVSMGGGGGKKWGKDDSSPVLFYVRLLWFYVGVQHLFLSVDVFPVEDSGSFFGKTFRLSLFIIFLTFCCFGWVIRFL